MEKVIIHKCVICNKDARTVDNFEEAQCELKSCDSNEYSECKTAKDNSSLRFVRRKKRDRKIDWNEVNRNHYKSGE